MSRGLMKRISSVPGADSQKAFGTSMDAMRVPSANARRNVYVRSHLGQARGIRRVGTEIGGVQHVSSGGKPVLRHLETGTNRPSAGFKEPPRRSYNPYG